MSVTDSCCEKGVPCVGACKALGAPQCPCPEVTFQLLCPREWMEQSQGSVSSFPREETPGCVSSDSPAVQRCHSSVTALPAFGLATGQ